MNNHKTPGEWKFHSGNRVIDCKTQGEWKIQLRMTINFISSKDSDETRTRRTTSDNIEIMMDNETDDITEELFKSCLQIYQEGLEESMRWSEFVFDSVDLLYYKLNKIILNRGESYVDFPEWLKNKKATVNPNSNDDKCFQCTLTAALNYQKIKNNPERVSKIKSFIDQYNWKRIDFPSHQK